MNVVPAVILVSLATPFEFRSSLLQWMASDRRSVVDRLIGENRQAMDLSRWSMQQFFAAESYRAIRAEFFAPSVASTTVIAEYDRET